MYSSYSFHEVIKISDVSTLMSRYPRTRIIPEYRFFKRNVPETNVRTHEDGVAPSREPVRVMQITHYPASEGLHPDLVFAIRPGKLRDTQAGGFSPGMLMTIFLSHNTSAFRAGRVTISSCCSW